MVYELMFGKQVPSKHVEEYNIAFFLYQQAMQQRH